MSDGWSAWPPAKRSRLDDGSGYGDPSGADAGVGDSLQDLMQTLGSASNQFASALGLPDNGAARAAGGGTSDASMDANQMQQAGTNVAELTFGTVKKTFPQKGFSLVSIDPIEGQDTVHVHSSVVSPTVICERQPVAFKLHMSATGQLQAGGPLWRLVGEIEEGETVTWGEYEGQMMPGGVVHCREILSNFGTNPCMDPEEMMSYKIKPEETIRFSITMDSTGKPFVKTPLWKTTLGMTAAGMAGRNADATGDSSAKGGCGKGKGKEAAVPPPPLPPPPGASDLSAGQMTGQHIAERAEYAMAKGGKTGRGKGKDSVVQMRAEELTFGYVKTVLVERGFSLCVTDPNNENDTVYAHHSIANPAVLAEGQPVAFKVHVNSRGQPQASKPMWRLVGEVAEGAAVSWGDFTGQVKGPRLMPNGSGFINCPPIRAQYNRDAYASAEVIDQCGLYPGDTVQFGIMLNSKGEPQALAPMWKRCSELDGKPREPPIEGQPTDSTEVTQKLGDTAWHAGAPTY